MLQWAQVIRKLKQIPEKGFICPVKRDFYYSDSLLGSENNFDCEQCCNGHKLSGNSNKFRKKVSFVRLKGIKIIGIAFAMITRYADSKKPVSLAHRVCPDIEVSGLSGRPDNKPHSKIYIYSFFILPFLTKPNNFCYVEELPQASLGSIL